MIREDTYGKGQLTIEEAQRTLDGLKSHGFLWDQDGSLTQDSKDEVMYHVTKKSAVRNSLLTVYFLSAFTTAEKYLRSVNYSRESGEKCITGDDQDSDSLLVHRLQMDILTHVTMKDTNLFDLISKICKS
jgi:hypothetical protein